MFYLVHPGTLVIYYAIDKQTNITIKGVVHVPSVYCFSNFLNNSFI